MTRERVPGATTVGDQVREPRAAHDAVIWIDHDQAVIVGEGRDGNPAVELLDRTPDETEAIFDGRAVDKVVDQDRVLVTGPAFARTDFERAYVAVTHRPDRLVDVEPSRTSLRPRTR